MIKRSTSIPPAAAKKRARRPKVRLAALGLAALLALGAYCAGLQPATASVVAKRRELPIYSVARDDSVIAISFDASWGADKTLRLLDILDEYGVKTTFFLVDIWVQAYPDVVKEIAARGHEIGNHSTTHPHMSQLSEAQIIKELATQSDHIEALTGARPTLFRPPYGDYNDRLIRTAAAEGYQTIQWSVDSLDWKNRGVQDIIARAKKAQSGDIVLFHNDAEYTVDALPEILDYYKAQGYKIVPVSEILLAGNTAIDIQGRQYAVQ
ncbi:MAG: polysaccharide deacetylase family protein [Clostridia bacterium]|nr:polysaccharide deacetylase family protein [Clostridia bacterium]